MNNSLASPVWEQFVARVEVSPDAIAVVDARASVSYLVLLGAAEAKATALYRAGIEPGHTVALLAGRSISWVVYVLALLKMGVTYVPVDSRWPAARVKEVCDDAGVVAFVSSLTNDSAELKTLTAADRIGGSAYVIYTSGSTGKPKGVMVSSAAVCAHLEFVRSRYCLTSMDRVLQFNSAAFDVSLEELLPSLVEGACVVLYPESRKVELEWFDSELKGQAITLLNLPTPFFRVWLETQMSSDDCSPGVLRSLVVGSDRVDVTDLEQWRCLGWHESVTLINAYGPTETTISCSCWEFSGDQEVGDRVPIGCSEDRDSVLVLGENGSVLEVGVIGEIAVAGERLADGYKNRPALTASRFVPHPAACAGERVYLTGDRGYWTDSGSLCFVGRDDRQIKLRGYRIELGELEAVACGHNAIRNAVALVNADGENTKVCMFVDVMAESELSPNVVRAYLSERLASYVVPSDIVCLTGFPTNANGKIDRHALKACLPKKCAPGLGDRTLVDILHSTLEVSHLDMSRDFFANGGDSLTLIRFVAAARKAGYDLHIDNVLRAASLAEFDGLVAANYQPASVARYWTETDHERWRNIARTNSVNPGNVEAAYPSGWAQQEMVFASMLSPGAYIEQFSCDLSNIDPTLLKCSWDALARVHPILQSTFCLACEPILAVIHANVSFPWRIMNWSDQEPAVIKRNFKLLRADQKVRGFDLSSPPLMRFVLIRIEESKWRLLWTHHHALTDGWSYATLFQDLFTIYDRLEAGEQAPMLRRTSYEAFVKWQRSQRLDFTEAYWREYFSRFRFNSLNMAARTAPARERPEIRFQLSEELTRSLYERAASDGLTLGMLVEAAWALAWMEFFESRQALIWKVFAVRPPELGDPFNTVGPMVSLLPCMFDREGADEALGNWVKINGKQHLEHLKHASVSMVDLERWGGLDSSVNYGNIFALQNIPDLCVDRISAIEYRSQTTAPVSVIVCPNTKLEIWLGGDGKFATQGTLDRLESLFSFWLFSVAKTYENVSDLN